MDCPYLTKVADWARERVTPDLACATIALLLEWEDRVLNYSQNPVLFERDMVGWTDTEIRMFDVIM